MKYLRLCCLLLVSATSMAAAREPLWYLGAGLNAMDIKSLCDGAPSTICDNSSLGVSLRGGWYLNRYLALEGMVDGAASFTSPAARAANLNGKTSVSTIGLGLVGFVPVGEKVSLLLGASAAYGEASTKIYAEGTAPRDCHYSYSSWRDDWEYYCSTHYDDDYSSGGRISAGAQAGIEFKPIRMLHIRASAQRYFSVDGGLAFGQRRDVDVVGVTLLLAF
jgi:hypothetical protein